MKKRKIIFTFNAPATLCFALVSLAALGLGTLTGGATAWSSPSTAQAS